MSSPRAFVIGWPIAHSRSPLIHNYWLRSLQLPGSYEKIAVEPDGLALFLADFHGLGFAGGNVTLPHKELAFAQCAKKTKIANALQAVNTLWMDGGELCGDNTDVAGFLASLDADAAGWGQACEKAVVLGAGGAARAIVAGLMSRGVPQIAIVNRTADRGEALIAQMRSFDSRTKLALSDYAALAKLLAEADLLVNTTSLGMKGQPKLDVDLTPLPAHAVVADIVYAPLETDMLKAARARGLKTSGGLGMLLHQAVPGFARWFGIEPHVTPELYALVARDIEASP